MDPSAQNANPGGLKFAGQSGATQGSGGFADFSGNTGQGFAALANQLQTDVTKNPNWNLVQFSSNYAPKSDGNDPGQYAADLANQLRVPPTTPISQLQSKIPQWAQAIAHNEHGYPPASGGVGQAAGAVAGAAGQALSQPGVAPVAAGLGVAGAALAPEIAEGEGVLGDIGGAVKSGLSDIGLGGIFGGGGNNNNTAQAAPASPEQPSPEQTALTAAEQPPAQQTQQTPVQETPVYNTIKDMASTMVAGDQINQEAKARGVDPYAEMVSSGNIPQPDQNGNLDKATPIQGLQALIKQDAQAKQQMAGTMQSQTSLADLEAEAMAEADQDPLTPDKHKRKKHIQEIFNNLSAEHPVQSDVTGKQTVTKKDQFITAPQLDELRKGLDISQNDWKLPDHERTASQKIYHAISKRQSKHAKQEGIKGWEDTNKRMEARFLAIKAIKKLPKKAQVDKAAMLRRELAGALGGAVIGKVLGHKTVLGGLAGALLERNIAHKKYKSVGSKHELMLAAQRKATPEKSLLSSTRPVKKGSSDKK